MNSNNADILLKAWTESLLKHRDKLGEVECDAISSGQPSRQQYTQISIQHIDSVLMKLFMLAKSENDIPAEVLAEIQKEIFTTK